MDGITVAAGNDSLALERHYGLLVRVARVISAAVLSRGGHNVTQARRFLAQHRLLVAHTLKRSAGIGTAGPGGSSQAELEDRTEELAEAFMILITASGFLEVRHQTCRC
jgi:nuclear pore complex protein Nup205